MATKKENKQKPLEQVLMDSCNKLRSNMSGINYMYFVMGLVFLKFASIKFEKRREELLNSKDNFAVNFSSFYAEKNVFYIPEYARWSFIKDHAKTGAKIKIIENGKEVEKNYTIGMLIDFALEELEKSNPQLRGGALPIGIYGKSTLPDANFVSLINEIDKVHEDEEHPMNDLIGKTYQYMLNAFAIKTADEKGEFYTPDNIVDLITTLIEPYKGRVYDPCCGSGGMFVQSYKFVEAHKLDINDISVYGQESNPDTWKLAKMNLGIRGIPANLGKKAADTFGDDQHKNEKFDFIIANPPFNLKNWRSDKALTNDVRWIGYGVPPASNANYAWILHMLSKLSANGVAGFLLANGALSDTNTTKIRENLIKNDKIEAIIILPREMFYYTDISVTLWIMNNNKNSRNVFQDGEEVLLRNRTNEILFMDLRKMGYQSSEGYKMLDDADMKLVKKTLNAWQSIEWKSVYKDVPEFCQSCNINEIRNGITDKKQKENGTNISVSDNDSLWSLIPSKYIEFIDHDLEIDFPKEMSRIQKEMKQLLKEEKKIQEQLKEAFEGIGYGIE
ncbi:N-6 DNA methylase [Metamycoplasma hyosynoviae]|uniref:class I SAM-dependent DNA methyltransferase n=1 Tax=Metamycoplasma hyosynoviae TaxID=29559 RepID=UPI0004617D98|nr:N-6 DNA methylase [Metamycoplasma hyosynoviae]KDE42663.1 DNA methyltransferase [Metamycoplasma hyosynoviae]KDE45439.1 DNA methyltransferase [Metamycoplasma hyosynoviae]KDE45625.1 DNA methyltransferase [Metamycoplasma hyosynoviae]MDC8912526.1 N-6 DNA methylase [Metamycoplasma hyosynoviae]MDC8920009.1 N-6 DNA methylase [Metamycoplasma hyosynoviae]